MDVWVYAPGIDDDPGRGFARSLNQVDQRAFMVRLVADDRQANLTPECRAGRFHIRQRRMPIDFRLAFAQQVQVRAVQKGDRLHRFLRAGAHRLADC